MVNTGKKKYSTLVQIYNDTGLPTGTTKSNDSTDADYIAPIVAPDDCPPPDPPDGVVNVIQIEFKNSSSESLFLTNINIVPSHLTIADSYYNSVSGFGLLPAENFIADKKNQLSNWTNLHFIVSTTSLGIRLKVTVSYKKHSLLVYTTVREFNVNIGSIVDELLLDTVREVSGASNLNKLKIEFTDNP